MENMRMKTRRDDANGSRFRGKVKEQAVKEIQLGYQKLSLGKVVPRSPKSPNALKPRKDVQFRSGGKTSSSQKEPIAFKPLIDSNYRFGDKCPVVQAMDDKGAVVNISWADVEKFLRDGDDPEESVVIGSVDQRDLDEAMERNEEPDEIFFRACEAMRTEAHGYATAAISYMRKKGHNLELVKPCLHSVGDIALGFRIHFNFKAKRAGDPSAPVETYFGQLRVRDGSDMVVECCVSLGASDSLPYNRDSRGCQYCTGDVHHPDGGCKGIIWGRSTWSPRLKRYVIT